MTNITPNKVKLYTVMDEQTTYQNGRLGSLKALKSRPYCIKKNVFSLKISKLSLIITIDYFFLNPMVNITPMKADNGSSWTEMGLSVK